MLVLSFLITGFVAGTMAAGGRPGGPFTPPPPDFKPSRNSTKSSKDKAYIFDAHFHFCCQEGTEGCPTKQTIEQTSNEGLAVLNKCFETTQIGFEFFNAEFTDQCGNAPSPSDPQAQEAQEATHEGNTTAFNVMFMKNGQGNFGMRTEGICNKPLPGVPIGGDHDGCTILLETLPGMADSKTQEQTICHEAGHWLGLDHKETNGNMMNAVSMSNNPGGKFDAEQIQVMGETAQRRKDDKTPATKNVGGSGQPEGLPQTPVRGGPSSSPDFPNDVFGNGMDQELPNGMDQETGNQLVGSSPIPVSQDGDSGNGIVQGSLPISKTNSPDGTVPDGNQELQNPVDASPLNSDSLEDVPESVKNILREFMEDNNMEPVSSVMGTETNRGVNGGKQSFPQRKAKLGRRDVRDTRSREVRFDRRHEKDSQPQEVRFDRRDVKTTPPRAPRFHRRGSNAA